MAKNWTKIRILYNGRKLPSRSVGVCQSVRLSVCLSVTLADCAKTAERIELLLGMKTPRNPRNIVLDGCPDSAAVRRGVKKF